MDILISPSPLFGKLSAICSKSDLHRLLICSAVADKKTVIRGFCSSEDISATIGCIIALGAKTDINGDICEVTPQNRAADSPVFYCGESGTTLRFMLPVACALCEKAEFNGSGRLPDRPIADLIDAVKQGGVTFSSNKLPFKTSGRLHSGTYCLPGNVSSQYVSGMLTALSLVEGTSEIVLSSPLESAGYVDMTISTLSLFGAEVNTEKGGYTVRGKKKMKSPTTITAEGDWSNALFFMAAGAIGGDVEIINLSQSSFQGDKFTEELLKRFGADVTVNANSVRVKKGSLRGYEISLSQIPDALPALAVVAAFADGETRFTGGKRLRDKESDRIKSVCCLINSLGGKASETEDGLTVFGSGGLRGGNADVAKDHRIVMAAAVAAAYCKEQTVIKGAQSVNKSYPDFFSDFAKIGGRVNVI